MCICPAYNVKALLYGGEVQLRIYEKSVGSGYGKAEEVKEMERDIREWHAEIDRMEALEERLTPWGNVCYKVVEEPQEKKKERSAHSSLGRTINKIYAYSRANEWQYFFTFTLSEESVDRYDYSACYKKVANFFHNVRTRYAPDIKYLVVPEQHIHGECKDGMYAWHFHALVSDIGNLKLERAINNAQFYKGQLNKYYGTPMKDSKGRAIYNVPGFRFGYTTATRIGDSAKAANYLCKYITKELCAAIPGKRRMIPSLNLKLPEEWLFYEDYDDLLELINKFSEMFDKKIMHLGTKCIKSDNFENRIHYVELK